MRDRGRKGRDVTLERLRWARWRLERDVTDPHYHRETLLDIMATLERVFALADAPHVSRAMLRAAIADEAPE